MGYLRNRLAVAASGLISVLFISVLAAPSALATSGYTFTNFTTGNVNMSGQRWQAIATSNTNLVAAVVLGGDIWTNNNYGAAGSWTNDTSANVNMHGKGWDSISSSLTGQYLVAVATAGDIWTSNNYGAAGSWTDETPVNAGMHDKNWQAVTSSSSGQYLTAVIYNGDVWTSNNYGASGSWTDESTSGPGSRLWNSVSSSSDGKYLAATVFNGDIWTNNNYGAASSWVNVTTGNASMSGKNWVPIALSYTGQYLVAAVDGGDVWTSNNYGVSGSWTDGSTGTSHMVGNAWQAAAISGSGKYITAGVYGGDLWASDNYGAVGSWTDLSTGNAGLTGQNWNALAADYSGVDVYAASYDGDVWGANDPDNNKDNTGTLPNALNTGLIRVTTPLGTNIYTFPAVTEASLSKQDVGYTYPLGLFEVAIETPHASDQIQLTFQTNLTPSQVVARDFNSTTEKYINVPGAVITETTLNGQPALLLVYTAADNGPLDSNPGIGYLTDPVGLAVAQTPDTGFTVSPTSGALPAYLLLIGFMTIGGGIYLRRRAFQTVRVERSRRRR
jgi:hypothetical protein